MNEVKWIKIVTDIFDDEKIILIEGMPEADSIIVIWFKLLCLAGKQNNGGVFMLNDKIAYTDEMLATIFRRPLNTVRLALKTFEGFGMVEIVDNVLTIPHWEKHQSLDVLEKARQKNREKVRLYREKQKLLLDSAKCNGYSNVTVPKCNRTDIDIDIDIDNNKENKKEEKEKKKEEKEKKTASGFKQPTLQEVKAYCSERGNDINAEAFIDYYEANGWRVGRNSMKDWRAAVRTWEKREAERRGGGNQNGKIPGFKSKSYQNENLDELIDDIDDIDFKGEQ